MTSIKSERSKTKTFYDRKSPKKGAGGGDTAVGIRFNFVSILDFSKFCLK